MLSVGNLDKAVLGKDYSNSKILEKDKNEIVKIFNRWIGEAVELSEIARHTLVINIISWHIVRDNCNLEEVIDKITGQVDRVKS